MHYFYDHVLKLVQPDLELGYFHQESVTIDPHGDVSSDYCSLKINLTPRILYFVDMHIFYHIDAFGLYKILYKYGIKNYQSE